MGIWCQNDVVSTTMRRHHETSFSCHVPAGYVLANITTSKILIEDCLSNATIYYFNNKLKSNLRNSSFEKL